MPASKAKYFKNKSELGMYGRSRSHGGAGKGSEISDSFGDAWLAEQERTMAARQYKCSACGKLKPSGICEHCRYNPGERRGW